MYLAKFFHRPPGDDDRELLLIPGRDPVVIGIYMGENRQAENEEFLREQFSGIAEAVSAFRRHASELAAAGYMETTHTRYTLRNLLPDPKPKSEWQKGLDELMLAALSSPLAEQAQHLAALQNHDAVDPALEELKRARSAQLIQERSRSILERNQTANTQFGPAILNWLLRGGDILGDNRSWFGARRVERNGLPVSFGSVFHTR